MPAQFCWNCRSQQAVLATWFTFEVGRLPGWWRGVLPLHTSGTWPRASRSLPIRSSSALCGFDEVAQHRARRGENQIVPPAKASCRKDGLTRYEECLVRHKLFVDILQSPFSISFIHFHLAWSRVVCSNKTGFARSTLGIGAGDNVTNQRVRRSVAYQCLISAWSATRQFPSTGGTLRHAFIEPSMSFDVSAGKPLIGPSFCMALRHFFTTYSVQ